MKSFRENAEEELKKTKLQSIKLLTAQALDYSAALKADESQGVDAAYGSARQALEIIRDELQKL